MKAMHRNPLGIGLAALTLAWLFTGCSTTGRAGSSGETGLPPGAPPQFRATTRATPGGGGSGLDLGWAVFGDPVLDALRAEAIGRDPGMELAAARLGEARAFMAVRGALEGPSVDTDASARLAGETVEQASLARAGLPARERGDRYQISLSARYELDLWGRLALQRQAADRRVHAAEADLEEARQVVSGEVARLWYGWMGLRDEKRILERTLRNRVDGVVLRTVDFEAGRRPETDLVQARLEVATLEAEVAALAADLERMTLALEHLCGPATRGILETDGQRASVAPPELPILREHPAVVLRRRPDVASAEAQWKAALSEAEATALNRKPDVRLQAGAGLDSLDLGDLLDRPAQFWQLGPVLHLPLFSGGRLKAEQAAAEARAQVAAARYRKAVLDAVNSIEQDAAELDLLEVRAEAVARARAQAVDLVQLARVRHDAGFGAYLEVVDAERSLLSLERTANGLQARKRVVTASLVRNLGARADASSGTFQPQDRP